MRPAFTSSPAYLALDASTRDVAVGVLSEDRWEALRQATGDALETIFRLTDEVLARSGRELGELNGVLFCAGPGSLLGLRLAAMAVGTWRQLPELAQWELRQYHSLHYMAATRQLRGERDFHVLSPFRREQLNHLQVIDGSPGEPGVLPVSALGESPPPRYFVPNGTLRTSPPEAATVIAYDLESLPEILRTFPERFPIVERLEIHVPIAPEFARWSAERHRRHSG